MCFPGRILPKGQVRLWRNSVCESSLCWHCRLNWPMKKVSFCVFLSPTGWWFQSLGWFLWENLNRKPWFLPSNMTGFPVNVPIIQFYDSNMFYFPFHIWDVILSIDKLHHFLRGLGQPPTSQCLACRCSKPCSGCSWMCQYVPPC